MDTQQQRCKKIALYKVPNPSNQKSKSVIECVNAKVRAFNKHNKKQKIETILHSQSSTSSGSKNNCFQSQNALDLLNDLVSLNNELLEENEQDIDNEVNKLRAKYKLPPLRSLQINSINYTLTHGSVNSQVNVDYSDDEDEIASKYPENIGKDSGCDIDYSSENIGKDSETEIFESKISIEEVELVDIDSHYENECSRKDELGAGIYNLTRNLDKNPKSDKCGAEYPCDIDHKYQKASDRRLCNKCSICSIRCKSFNDLKRHVTTQHIKRRSSSSGSSLEIIEID